MNPTRLSSSQTAAAWQCRTSGLLEEIRGVLEKIRGVQRNKAVNVARRPRAGGSGWWVGGGGGGICELTTWRLFITLAANTLVSLD